MLHALELENFKAFGKRARIPFAPITLIFGENSAGKSTILQALYLLKQTLESRDTGTLLLPRTENGIVDLGSFQEMLFDHDLERTLSIRIETTVDRKDITQLPPQKNKIAIEFSFKRPSVQAEVFLDQIGIYDGKSTECIAKFQPLSTTEKSEEFWNRMGYSADSFLYSSSIPKSATVECTWLTKEPEYWELEFESCKENKAKIRRQLEESIAYLEISLKHELDKKKDRDGLGKWFEKDIDYLRSQLEFLSADFDWQTYISRRHKEEMNAVLMMEGLLPTHRISSQRDSLIVKSHSLLYRRSDNTETFDVAQLAIRVGSMLDRMLGVIFPMSPFRRPPERSYIFRGNTPQNVGYQGNLLPDLLLRRPELVQETNEWLKRLDIDYKLEVKPLGGDSGDLFDVRLIDTRRKEPVSVALPDVGFGISQLLPFVVQSLVSERQIISIEQPEVHVHPRLQADLGDLLAEAIKEPRQNRFIIETHSEHLILRLQRLVRKKQIEPEDVSVIYVSRGPEGAKAERLRLDEEGDFIDEWPNGFFLERLREL